MGHSTAHRSYLDGSPFYATLYSRYGARMPLDRAQAHAQTHYTTVEALSESEGLKTHKDGTVSTLDFVQALGY